MRDHKIENSVSGDRPGNEIRKQYLYSNFSSDSVKTAKPFLRLTEL